MSRFSFGGTGLKVQVWRCREPVYKETLSDYPDIQALDSKFLYGVEHLEFALQKAKMAMENGGGISSNIFLETIVRASGQRQIKKALEKYGLNGSTEIAIFGENIPRELQTLLGAEEIEIIIDPYRMASLKEAFAIKDEELDSMSDLPTEAIKDLIKERMALVSIL
jgi:KEOPS complex subunit Cgi121